MDPLLTPADAPDADGYVAVGAGAHYVHYEMYLPPHLNQREGKQHQHQPQTQTQTQRQQQQQQPGGAFPSSNGCVLVVMGAFATKDHFASTARHLASAGGYEVCIYDHRGVGRSSLPAMERQTSQLLAEDAVQVLDALWGPACAVHVYGASMGGMVAQQLALMLLEQGRLLSLGLAVTCRGLKPLGGLLGPIFRPQIVKPVLQAWYWDSRPALVRRLMRLVLSRNVLEMTHPSGESYEQVYFREWLRHFDDWWTFGDHTAGACHACVVLHHHLSERQIAVLRDSGVPILCQISTRDHLIPPGMQYELARKLRAKVVEFPTGHMGLLPWKDQYHRMLLEHFATGSVLRGVAEAERARAWKQLWAAPVPGKKLLSSALSVGSSLSEGGRSDASFIGTAPAAGGAARRASSSSGASSPRPADLEVEVPSGGAVDGGSKGWAGVVAAAKERLRGVLQPREMAASPAGNL